ncbi:hypothetical protein [Flavobacterium sp. PL12]|uniref:hypothetical protein n=1 Tax=Flavobacterium sp. PL12 TaxID=3071718 RepID=UPI00319EBCB3
MSKTKQINQVLQSYFEENISVKIIPAKDMMPYFILAGVFPKDNKNGLPIRNVLRRLDDKNQLHLIPYVYAERKNVNTNWFFQRINGQAIDKSKPPEIKLKYIKIKEPKPSSRKDSDEHYVLDLCDQVLQVKGLRQHRFDFLLGDANAQGRKAKLPVDIYYPELNLVIEYKEQQHSKANKHFDKPDLFTVSGVHRGEQRKIYDQRRREVLPQHNIKLIEIEYSDFQFDSKDKIVRELEKDLGIVKEILKK